MAIAFKIQYGAYTLVLTLRPVEESSAFDTAPQALPRRPGALSQTGRREPTVLSVSGEIGGSGYTFDDVLALQDAIKAAAAQGKQILYWGRDDQYYKDAQLKSFSIGYDDGKTYGVVPSVKLTFACEDYPEAFGTVPLTPSLTSTGATVTNPGSAYGLPAWTIVVNGSGTGPVTLANTTTGESVAIGSATVSLTAGHAIILDRDGNTVTDNGVAAPQLSQGRIPRLAPGDNTITLSAGGSATVTSLAASYIQRFA